MRRLLHGLIVELRLVPLIGTLAAVYLGFIFAKNPFIPEMPLFLGSIFLILYTVHFLDTYEDYYVRKEDKIKTLTFAHGASGLLKRGELIAGSVICSLGFFIITFSLYSNAGPVFLILCFAGYLIGITYSRYLSRNPIASSLAYPVSVELAIGAAYLLASGNIDLRFFMLSIPVLSVLIGAKIWLDIADADTDRRTGKPNIVLKIGMAYSKGVGFSFILVGLLFSTIFYSSLLYLFVILPISAFFFKGLFAEPKAGIYYIMTGVFLFIVIQAVLQYSAIV